MLFTAEGRYGALWHGNVECFDGHAVKRRESRAQHDKHWRVATQEGEQNDARPAAFVVGYNMDTGRS
jgi:hypothetical protein